MIGYIDKKFKRNLTNYQYKIPKEPQGGLVFH